MIFGQDRDELRNMYREAWSKFCKDMPLTPLENQIAAVIEWHPEYHDDLVNEALDREYTPEGGRGNPYLHMGLHLGIREQVTTNRPAGIQMIYKALVTKTGDQHAAEHQMIDCLAETLWEAQSQNRAPDEQKYLERLRRLNV
ncbi:MAG TPA: DUF1841 family protein [Woeseiaceae bacterium]|nr:DUF1841 family protein [Woeseiaceae bacterium]